ncbi:MAG: hypothetical protein GY950_00650 [bacterium]|nr:hypothetical protein [bacterium]
MRDRGLDMYILRFDDRYEDVDIVLNTRKVKDVETVTLQRSKGRGTGCGPCSEKNKRKRWGNLRIQYDNAIIRHTSNIIIM